MNNLKYLIIALLTITIVSCENTAKETQRFSQYFDVDSLIDSQLDLVAGNEKILYKVATLNDMSDTTKYVADSLQLAQELNVFRKANINKPAFDDKYERSIKDSGEEKVITYTTEEELEVRHVKLTYDKKVLKQMEAYVIEDHWLYDSKRTLIMNFSENEGLSLLKGFSIEGSQKMILRDRVNFTVLGNIKSKSITAVHKK